MFLDFFNSLFSSYFAWVGLALLAVMGAALAILYLFTPSRIPDPDQPSLGFTCPCYAPPVIQMEEEKDKTA